jgi:hypothetical protein
MPSFSVLHDISTTLQSQIVAALNSAPDISFDVTTDTLSLSPPSDDLEVGTVAVLYLYHVSIDPHLRNQQPIPDAGNPSLFIRPPLPLMLKYLFVPLDAEEENNQLMLGRVLQHFHDAPTIRPIPGSPLATSRGGLPDHLRVRPDFAGFEALSPLWSALARPFRLSAGFMVDIVGVDSAEPATVAPRTGTTFTVNRKLTEGAT